jgi:tetratricopeptide (TPR) repeat protein
MTAENDSHFDFGLGDRLYREAFQKAGIDVEGLSTEEAAGQIRQSTVVAELAAELDLWAETCRYTRLGEEHGRRHLLRVASLADPDERRGALRQSLASGEREKLLKRAVSEDVFALPPASLIALAWALERTGAGAQAMTLLREARQRQPDDFWLNEDLGRLLLFQPGQAEEAARFFTAAVALRPQSSGAHINLGVALKTKGDLEGAIREFQAAVLINPRSAMAHYNLGLALKAKEDPDGAIAEFRAALEINPNYPDAHCTLGKVLYYRKGDREGGIGEYLAELNGLHCAGAHTPPSDLSALSASPDGWVRKSLARPTGATHSVRQGRPPGERPQVGRQPRRG